MIKPSLRVGVLQITSTDDLVLNYEQIKGILQETKAREQSLDLVCLPENALFMRVNEGERIKGISLTDEVFSQLSLLAQEYAFFIHIGSSPLLLDGHLYNSSVLITPHGEVRPTYKKMHLFDIQLQGQKPVRESDVFRHGPSPSILEIYGWKIGESICYDLRFSELYAHYARKAVDMILIPSAFLVKTGEAHWHVLMRARAIESQAYVVASAQTGTHQGIAGGLRQTYGHSLVVDPWGQIQAEAPTERGLLVYECTKQRLEEVRRQIPMSDHRRIPVLI